MQNKILFASKNKGKIREVSNLFAPIGIQIIGLEDMPPIPEIAETGLTFEENALIKATEVWNIFGLPVISDDSGLSVEQLGGAPGIYSARFAGANATDALNNSKLLESLSAYPPPHRAKYVCSAVYMDSQVQLTTMGEVHGTIIKTPKGSGGFGYDPYFVPDGFTETMAELPLIMKNSISHRGKAFSALYNLYRETFNN